MSDLNWCPVCDKAIHPCSHSLYCSLECLQHDAIQKNPLLGYSFTEFKDFLPSPMARRRFKHHDDEDNDDEDCHDDRDDRSRRQPSSLACIPRSSSSSSNATNDSLSPILSSPRQITKCYPIFAFPRRYRS